MEDKFVNHVRNEISNVVKITNAVYKILEFFPESDPLKNKAKEKALSIMENLILSANRRVGKEDWISLRDYLQERPEKPPNGLLEDIEILLSLLKLGKLQGWINDVNFLIIYNEYEKIKKEIPQILPAYGLPMPEILKGGNIDNKESLLYTGPEEEKLNIPSDSPSVKTEKLKPNLSVIKSSEGKEKKHNNPEGFISERQAKILKFLKENKKAQVTDLKKVLSDVTKRTIRRDLDDLLKKGSIVRAGEWNQVFYQISANN